MLVTSGKQKEKTRQFWQIGDRDKQDINSYAHALEAKLKQANV